MRDAVERRMVREYQQSIDRTQGIVSPCAPMRDRASAMRDRVRNRATCAHAAEPTACGCFPTHAMHKRSMAYTAQTRARQGRV